MKRSIADGSPTDADLFQRVESEATKTDWRTLDAARLAVISSEKGIDFATALFYAALHHSYEFGETIRRIDVGIEPDVSEVPALVLMPGAFHRHHNNTGADGARLLAAAKELGWATETISVGSLASVHANAAMLIDCLRRHPASKIVVASLSKGSADVATAMRHPMATEAFRSVCGWISLSGMIHGTPLINWIRRRPLRAMGVHLLLWAKHLRFAQLDELQRSPGGLLDRPVSLPAHLRAIHVIGCPLRQHLRHPWATRGYERIAPLGPNDGGGILLGDATRFPGLTYPVWGADHYLNPKWDFAATLRNLLLHAAASHPAASAMPATKSTT